LPKKEYSLDFNRNIHSLADSGLLEKYDQAILQNFPTCKQVLITTKGKLIHEFNHPRPKTDSRMPCVNGIYSLMIPFFPHLADTMRNNRGEAWNGRSVTKCIMSALTGIALEKGVLKNLDITLGESLPDVPKDKQGITLRQLLTMTSGLPFTDKIPEMPRWLKSKNWVEYLLSLPLGCRPGEKFSYSSGNTHLLAAVIDKCLDTKLREFAQTELFDPLGFGNPYWEIDPQGIPFGSANLFLPIRDMLKIGYLYLQKGFWQGKQLLSQEWVSESTTSKVYANDHFEYGYAWWLRDFLLPNQEQPVKVICACGWAGQRIYIIPKMEIVTAIISKADLWAVPENLDKLLGEFLLPAMRENSTCVS
jgi:CubicO group peptidase (beta-lactamase class C family)